MVELSDEALADPAAQEAAIAEHQRRTGQAAPVVLAPVEEWAERNR